MKNLALISQIFISVFLVAAIVIQARGTGLGSVFGGGGESYRSRRGMEKIFFIATIILAVLFIATSIVNVMI